MSKQRVETQHAKRSMSREYGMGWQTWHGVRGICGKHEIPNTVRLLGDKKAVINACASSSRCKYAVHWQPEGSDFGKTFFSGDHWIKAGFTVLCDELDNLETFQQEGWSLTFHEDPNPEAACADSTLLTHPMLAPLLGSFGYDAADCNACDHGKYPLFSCSQMNRRDCYLCPGGFCPGIREGRPLPFIRESARCQSMLEKWPAAKHPTVVATNPSLVQHGGVTYALVRVTDQHRCDGKYWKPPPQFPYSSDLMVCAFDERMRMDDQSCRIINGTAEMNRLFGQGSPGVRSYIPNAFDFLGIEDPRGISVNGRLYVSGSVVVTPRDPKQGKTFMIRMVLAMLNERLDGFERMSVLYSSADPNKCVDGLSVRAEKNWVFLSHSKEHSDSTEELHFHFVTSFRPFTVVSCNVETGCCLPHKRIKRSCEGGRGGELAKMLRGGSPAVSLEALGFPVYAMLVHVGEQIEHDIGVLYHHAFAFVSVPTEDHASELLAVSKPFRLPGNTTPVVSQNVQFGTGFLLDNSDRTGSVGAYISYGVGDCTAQVWHINSLLSVFNQVLDAADFDQIETAESLDSRPRRIRSTRRGKRAARFFHRHAGFALRDADSVNDVADESVDPTHGAHSLDRVNALALTAFDPLTFTSSMIAASTPGRRVRWEGTLSGTESFAVVNQIMIKLLRDMVPKGLDSVTVLDTNKDLTMKRRHPYSAPRDVSVVHDFMSDLLTTKTVDLTIRNGWPPNFNLPQSRLSVIYMAWEFFAIPTSFVAGLNRATEVWTPSSWVRDGMLASGVDAHRVHVIPHGVDPSVVCPERKDLHDSSIPQIIRNKCESGTEDPFLFLYHGGILERKATDLVLEAFEKAFLAHRDSRRICLILHSTYAEESLSRAVDVFIQAQPVNTSARMVLVKDHLSQRDLSALYKLSHVLVHTSRSEGFGLSVLEAMACGLPVITLSQGAHLDFTTADTVISVPSFQAVCRLNPCSIEMRDGVKVHLVKGLETPIPPRWFMFRPRNLADVMIRVVTDPGMLKQKAIAAMEMSKQFSWVAVQQKMHKRLQALFTSDEPGSPTLRTVNEEL
jgi:glycosyltransferase involved in cell wall biosynthesis